MKFREFLDSILTLPQTQRDIRKIAEATEYAQSPEARATLEQAQATVEAYATTQLVLQVLSTVAILGLLYVSLKNGKR